MTPSHSLPKRSSSLDLLRVVAIGLVFTSHFRIFASQEWFATIGTFGWAGVDLFFVLSGFLIASQLFIEVQIKQSISWKKFYLRRGFRIWPNYLVVLFLYFTFPVFTERGHLAPLWKFLTFTQNFGLDYRHEGTFSHAWSLCVEEQFYLVLPFLILFMNRFFSFKKSIAAFIFVILGGIGLRYGLWEHFVEPYAALNSRELEPTFYREIYYPTYCRLDGLTVGVAIAALYRLRPKLWSKVAAFANLFFVFGIAGLVGAYFVCEEQHLLLASALGYPLIAFSFGAWVIAAISPVGFFSKLRMPFVKTGAMLAFSFYLTHKSLIHLSKGWMDGLNISEASVLYPLGIFISCLLASTVLYLLIEKAFLAWRERLLSE